MFFILKKMKQNKFNVMFIIHEFAIEMAAFFWRRNPKQMPIHNFTRMSASHMVFDLFRRHFILISFFCFKWSKCKAFDAIPCEINWITFQCILYWRFSKLHHFAAAKVIKFEVKAHIWDHTSARKRSACEIEIKFLSKAHRMCRM